MRRPPPKGVRLRALGVEALVPGEKSEKVRIRGPEELFELLKRLSPKERGRALLAGLEALGYKLPKQEGRFDHA